MLSATIEIPKNQEVSYLFPSDTRYFLVQNLSYVPVLMQLNDDTEDVTIKPNANQTYRTRATEAKFRSFKDSGLINIVSQQKEYISSVISFAVDSSVTTPYFVRTFPSLFFIKAIAFKFLLAFDVPVSLGFHTDNFWTYLESGRDNTLYYFPKWYQFEQNRDMFVYFWGFPTKGAMVVYVEV